MKEGIWVEDEQGNQTYMPYDEIDPEILGQLWKPIGGFCYPVDGFMRLALPPVPFYIKDWLPKPGKMILYAPAKAGKSYVTYQVARCIGAGVPFLEIPTTQGRVLVVQFELGASILQKRLRETGQDYENVFVGTTFAMKLDTTAGQEQLVKALEAVRPNVVILDPLAKLLTGDENESHDVRPILDFIDTAMEAFDCSFIIVHHAGKDLARGGRGTSVLMDYPDSYIEMKRTSQAGQPLKVKISPKLLRHAELPPDPIEAELVGFEFERIGKEPSVAMKVKEIYQRDKVAPAKALIDSGIGSRKSIYDAINKWIKAGDMVQQGRGVYRWIGGEQVDKPVGNVI